MDQLTMPDAIEIAEAYGICDLNVIEIERVHANETAVTGSKSAVNYFDDYMADIAAGDTQAATGAQGWQSVQQHRAGQQPGGYSGHLVSDQAPHGPCEGQEADDAQGEQWRHRGRHSHAIT
jgi:hypothetical protein